MRILGKDLGSQPSRCRTFRCVEIGCFGFDGRGVSLTATLLPGFGNVKTKIIYGRDQQPAKRRSRVLNSATAARQIPGRRRRPTW